MIPWAERLVITFTVSHLSCELDQSSQSWNHLRARGRQSSGAMGLYVQTPRNTGIILVKGNHESHTLPQLDKPNDVASTYIYMYMCYFRPHKNKSPEQMAERSAKLHVKSIDYDINVDFGSLMHY